MQIYAADIGKPERIIEIDPLKLPEREPVPEEIPEQVPPEREPVKIP